MDLKRHRVITTSNNKIIIIIIIIIFIIEVFSPPGGRAAFVRPSEDLAWTGPASLKAPSGVLLLLLLLLLLRLPLLLLLLLLLPSPAWAGCPDLLCLPHCLCVCGGNMQAVADVNFDPLLVSLLLN